MSPQRMGLPVDRLVIATNVNDILARTLATGTYELREVVATSSPSMDIQVSSNFERLLFEAYGRDAAPVRALMGSLAQSRRFALSARGAVGDPRACSPPTAPTRRRPPRPSAPLLRETGRFVDPHTAVGVAVAEKETRDPAMPMVVLVDRASGQVPRCGRGGLRRAARRCRTGLPTCMRGPSASRRCRSIRRAVERFILAASRAAREGAAA